MFMAARARPPPINVSASGPAGGPPGSPPGVAPGGAAGGGPVGGPGESFISRYQEVSKGYFEALTKALKVVEGAALAMRSFGYGLARQSILHPLRTAQDVKAELNKVAQKISAGTKGAVQGLEERLMYAELTQLSAKINSLSGSTDGQRKKVLGDLHTSLEGMIKAQTANSNAGSVLGLLFKYEADGWKMMAAVRSHEQLVDDMSDGRMSPIEWIYRRAQLAAAGITNRALLAVDPFRAHSDYQGSGATV